MRQPLRSLSSLVALLVASLIAAAPAAAQVRRPMPVVQRLSPSSGPPGTSVTMHGRHYDNAQTVWLGDVQCEVTSRFPNRWTVTIGEGAQTGTFEVRTERGNVRGPRFRVSQAAPPPTVSGFSPANGAAGAEVTLQGTNFSPRASENTVHLGERPVVVRRATPTELQVLVPSGVESGVFRVRVSGAGEASSEETFIVGSGTQVTAFEPAFGPPGTRVTLTGVGFDRRRTRVRVYLGEDRARVIRASATELTVELPRRGATTGRWLVDVRGGGRAYSEAPFQVRYAPTISAMSPEFGAPGTRVTLTGTHFGTDIRQVQATLGETPMRVRDIADGQLVLEIPAGGATGDVSVTVAGMGPATSASPLQVTQAVAVEGFRPRSGPVGSEVTLLGQGFSGDPSHNTVTMNGRPAEVVSVTPTNLTVRVPEGSSGPLVVEVANAGEARTDHPFVITTPPIVERFSPAAGPPGTEVTLEGRNFGRRRGLVRVRLGDQSAEVRTVTDEQIVVVIPDEGQTGAFHVTIRLQGNVTTEESFTVER